METESDFINGFVVLNQNKTIIGYVTYFYAYYTWIGKLENQCIWMIYM